MCFFILLFIFIDAPEPVREIKVDNQGRFLDRIDFGTVVLERDGTFLANNFFRIWHWSSDGQLINAMGSRGSGPGEFESLSEVLWDGTYYWALDASRQASSIFDKNGTFLFRTPISFRKFIRVGQDQLFAVDPSRYNPFEENYPPIIREIKYSISDNEIRLHEPALNFRKVTPRQAQLNFNFKLVWLVRDGDTYFAVDQIEPKIQKYTPKHLLEEQSTPLSQTYIPHEQGLLLPDWISPPEQMARSSRSKKEQLIWWNSWSRINFFAQAGEHLAIGYESADPNNNLNRLQYVQLISHDGKLMGKPLVVEGRVIGVKNELAYIFESEDNDTSFNYFIRCYPLKR